MICQLGGVWECNAPYCPGDFRTAGHAAGKLAYIGKFDQISMCNLFAPLLIVDYDQLLFCDIVDNLMFCFLVFWKPPLVKNKIVNALKALHQSKIA